MNVVHSDALVFFGATGDLAYKKIFPALQAMLKRGNLDVPVIGMHTLDVMKSAGATCLSVEAGRTLLFDRDALLRRANEESVAIIALAR